MNQSRAIQPLTEGAILAALTTVLGIMSLGVPVFRVVTDFLWGIPIILLLVKYETKVAVMALVVSVFLMLLFFDPLTVLLFAIEMSPLALCYGFLIRKQISAGKSLVIGTVVAVGAELLTILGFLYLAHINVVPAKEELLRQANEALKLYKQVGLIDMYAQKGISEEMLKEALYQSVRIVALLTPAFLVLSSIVRAFLTWIVAGRVMRRVGFAVNELPRFSAWSLPWYWVWFLISGLILVIAGDYFHVTVAASIGKNVTFVTAFVYLIIGLSVAVHLLKNWRLPTWIKIFVVLVSLLNLTGTLIMLVLLGVFDAFVVFRRFSQPEDKA